MKLNKTIGRVATTLVATAMLASLAAPAYAEPVTAGTENKPVTSVTITKTVETDGNTYAPKATFTFNVEEGAGKKFNDGTGTVTAEAGIKGGLKAGDGAVFTPNSDEAPAAEYTATDTLNVDADVFKVPGIYHYVVTEKDFPDNDFAYEGITKDSSSYDVYLYVYNNSTYTDLYVGHVVTVKNGDTDAKADLAFTNDYGKTNDTTHDVTVTKKVEGSLANMSDTFSFDVKVDGASGEAYKVVYTNGEAEHTTVVTSGSTTTVSGIGDKDTITIYGLSANDTYTVTEKDGVSRGYTVTDSVGENDGVVSGKVPADGTAATITNTKNGSAPTGIVMNVAPYALLVVVAAAGCFVFLRKRRED